MFSKSRVKNKHWQKNNDTDVVTHIQTKKNSNQKNRLGKASSNKNWDGRLRTPYSSKIDILLSKKDFLTVAHVKLQFVSFLNGIKNETILLSYIRIIVDNINSEIQ